MLLYFLINVIYVYILPMDAIATAPQDGVGTLLMNTLLGNGGLYFMAALIMVSTFGCFEWNYSFRCPCLLCYGQDEGCSKELNKNEVPASSLAFRHCGPLCCLLQLFTARC